MEGNRIIVERRLAKETHAPGAELPRCAEEHRLAGPQFDALLAAAQSTATASEALPLWDELRKHFPEIPIGHIGYGYTLLEADRLSEAEDLLAQTVERFPGELWAAVHHTRVAVRRGDWSQALQRSLKVRTLFPDDPSGHVGYATALLAVGRLDEAEALLAQSRQRFPDDIWAWVHYAEAAMRRGDWVEGLQRWKEARGQFPADSAVYRGMVEAVARIQEYGLSLVGASLPLSTEIQQRCLSLFRLLEPKRIEGFNKARFGSEYDGGYVMVDDFAGITAAFSFGIAQDANWDAAVADRGIPVYQFDHTIDAPPIARSDLIWTKAPIVPRPAQGGETIDELVSRHGKPGENSLILKIDIDGDEWPVFDAASEAGLLCFSQILCEFSFLMNVVLDAHRYDQALRVLKKLTDNFAVVHVHANNGHGLYNIANVMVPHVLEITFVNKHRYRVGINDEIFPGALDTPNNPHLPDIHLGRFIY